jgi:hypothetical protein
MELLQHYVLDDDGQPLPVADFLAWAQWFQKADRVVASDMVGAVHISTVFLGLDHNFHAGGPPVLWETMIFGGPHDLYQRRYISRDEAIAGHATLRALVVNSETGSLP